MESRFLFCAKVVSHIRLVPGVWDLAEKQVMWHEVVASGQAMFGVTRLVPSFLLG